MTRVLGIDPGSRFTGYGVIDCERDRRTLVVCGRIATGDGEMPSRLLTIDRQLDQIISTYRPDEAAIEEVFVSRNVRSALVLGQARGVAMCALARSGMTVAEYAATQVKMALTGSGRADKDQVQHMVRVMLNARERLAADASDALAVALTHAQVRTMLANTGLPVRRSWRRR